MKYLAFIVVFLMSFSMGGSGSVGERGYVASKGHVVGAGLVEADKVVYLVRHGETCLDQGSNPHLSSYGRDRASELARVLMDEEIQEIYSTPFYRTIETATPISESTGKPITQIAVQAGFVAELASTIRESTAERILISGHSNTTPALINLLIGTTLPDLTEFDFDRLYVVHLREDGTGMLSTLRYGAESGKPSTCTE